MKIILIILVLNTFLLAQPTVISEKIIHLNQPLANVKKIKKINTFEYGAVGNIIHPNGRRDMFFAKFNKDSLIFSQSYNYPESMEANDFALTGDGGFILVGDDNYDIVFQKINSDGDSIWSTKIDGGPSSYNSLNGIVKIDNDHFMASGYYSIDEFGLLNSYLWLVKINSAGIVQWQKKFHNGYSYWPDYGVQIELTIDNNIIVSGTKAESMFLLKTDFSGNERFFRDYGYISNDMIVRYSSTDQNNSYFFTGSIPIWNHDLDIFLMKTDDIGDTIFFKNYNGNPISWNPNTSSGEDYGIYIKNLNNNKIIIGGNGENRFTNNNIMIILYLDSDGNIIWKHILEKQYYSRLMLIEESNEHKLLYLGKRDVLPNNIFIITTDFELTNITNEEKQPIANVLYQNYPNPFNPTTTIKYNLPQSSVVLIQIFNSLGEKIKTLYSGLQTSGSHKIVFDGSSLPSGIYFYQITTKDFSQTKKCLLLK